MQFASIEKCPGEEKKLNKTEKKLQIGSYLQLSLKHISNEILKIIESF